MRVYFERSGGFAGLHLKAAVDTADLPAEDAQAWEKCLAEAEFFNSPSRLKTEVAADSFIYRLTVVTAEQEHTAEWSEENTPEKLRPMLHQLATMARKR